MSKIIFIGGYPKTGKSTHSVKLSQSSGLPVIHTDSYIGQKWEEIPDLVIADARKATGGVIVEGIQCGRVARRILRERDYADLEIDTFYQLTNPFVGLTADQIKMAKGINTIFQDVHRELVRAKVKLVFGLDS